MDLHFSLRMSFPCAAVLFSATRCPHKHIDHVLSVGQVVPLFALGLLQRFNLVETEEKHQTHVQQSVKEDG